MIPFQQAYDEFVKQKGDLFEVNEVTIDEADGLELEKLNRFSKKITYPFFLVIGIGSFLTSVYLFLIPEWIYAFGFLMCAVALVALSFYFRGHYSEVLSAGKKIVMTGIISKIKKSGSYYGLTISNREEIFFSETPVKGFKAGDIIRCQYLKDDEGSLKKIERIGNIRDWVG